MSEAKIILDACCGSRMFWFDKENPLVLFTDIRDEEHTPVSYTHLAVYKRQALNKQLRKEKGL